MVRFAGISIILGVGLWLSTMADAANKSACFSEPLDYFKSGASARQLQVCESENGKELFCRNDQAEMKCKRLNLSPGRKVFSSVREIRDANHPNRDILAAYLALMEWETPARFRSNFSIQTGDYPLLTLSRRHLQTPCFREVLQAAYKVHKNFAHFNFRLDEGVRECRYLVEGVNQLVQNSTRVKANVSRFHSPLHTIFLTNKTKFNHFLMGEIGLHINANKKDEIKRRLIDDQISERQIPHETNRKARVSVPGTVGVDG